MILFDEETFSSRCRAAQKVKWKLKCIANKAQAFQVIKFKLNSIEKVAICNMRNGFISFSYISSFRHQIDGKSCKHWKLHFSCFKYFSWSKLRGEEMKINQKSEN